MAKCKLFQSITKNAVWLKKQYVNDLNLLRSTLNDFHQHLKNGCFCTSRSATYMAMGSTYLVQFYLMFERCIEYLDEEEAKLKKTREEKSKQNTNYINDIDLKEESSFIAYYNENISLSNLSQLTNNLFNALKMFQKALECDKKENILTFLYLEKLATLEDLNSLFQIFLYYGLDTYAFKTVDLALILVKTYYNENTENEKVITTQCNLIRLLLRLGFLETACLCYKKFFPYFKLESFETIDSFGHSQIFLLYCELRLRNRNGKPAAEKLKEFLAGEYVKKCTIKRNLIKTMALSLASKFPSGIYSYESYFSEFVDPTQMSVGICRRWKMFKVFFPGNYYNPSDPWWIRFCTLNVFTDSIEQFIEFHLNNGLTTDPVFYYKIATNLFAVTLNLLRLTKLQLIGSNYDIRNCFLIDAKFKLLLFKKHYQNNISNDKIFMYPCEKSVCCTSSDQNESLYLLMKDLSIHEPEDSHWEEPTDVVNALYQCYKRIIIESRVKSSEVEDLYFNQENISVKNLLKNFLTDFGWLKLPKDFILQIFSQYLFYFINNFVIYHQELSPNSLISQEQYLNLLDLFENFTKNIYVDTFKNLFTSSSIKALTSVRTTMEEQINNGPISNLFWIWSCHFIRLMMANHQESNVLCYLERLVEVSAYSYRERMYRSQMFYYRALALYRCLKKSNFSFPESRKIFKLYTNMLKENINIPLDKQLTSTPPNQKKNIRQTLSTKLKAPMKSGHVSDIAKQYGQSLLEMINIREGPRRNCFLDEIEDLIQSNQTGDQMELSQTKNMNSGKRYSKSKTNESNGAYFESQDDLEHFDNDFSAEKLFEKLVNFEKDPVGLNYFNDLFALKKNPSVDTVDEIKQLLKKVVSYVGCHIGHELYTQTQLLYYKLAKLTSKHVQIILYHLAETASQHSFRTRLIFNSLKKINNGKTFSYDLSLSLINFKHEDFYFQPYYNDLPKTWRFVQIKLIETKEKFPNILVTRFQNGIIPLFFKIKCDPQKVQRFFTEEFEEVMKMNSISIIETQKEAFWKLRYEYDNKLKCVLESVENDIFGLARGIFLGQLNDKKYKAVCSLFRKKILECSKEMNLACQDNQFFDLIIESMVLLTSEEIELAAKKLFDTEEKVFIKKFKELRKKCFSNWINNDKAREILMNSAQPVGLIIDPVLNQFPFESLPSFRHYNQPFFRVPSLRITAMLYKRHKSIVENGLDDKETFYLLNPGNNLENTEKYFKDSFESIKEWTGVVGKCPDGKILEQNLETKDIYVYMGHGSGSHYYRLIPNGLDLVNINSLSVVVGCSSGRLTKEMKTADTFGCAYRFILNGAPAYIGTLWDITDKDIDVFFDNFMSCWFKRWKQTTNKKKMTSLCRSISSSRNSCKLKHLIGCAPVVYGLPINNLIKE